MTTDTPATPSPATPAPAAKPARFFYGWYIVAASFVSNMLTGGIYWQGFQVFFLPLIEEFGWSRASLSLAFSFREMETGIGAPIVGVLVDRLGPRRIIMLSGFVMGLGMMLLALTQNLIMFYAFFILASLGASGTSHAISWSVVVSRWFRRKRGTAIGIAMSGPVLSGPVLLVLAWGLETVGWRWTVAAAGALLWFTVIPLANVVRDHPSRIGLLPDGDVAEPVSAVPSAAGAQATPPPGAVVEHGYTVREALTSSAFWLLAGVLTCLFFGLSSFQVHQVAFFQNDAGLSSGDATLALGIVFLVSAVGRLGVGWLADRMDIRRVLLLVVALNLCAWIYLAFVPVHDFGAVVPFTVLFGVPFGGLVAVRPLLMSRLFGGRSLGSLMGLFQMTALVSGMVGPVVMGYIYDTQGSYRMALWIFIALSSLALPLPFLVRTRSLDRPAA